jgi:DNA-directed RNA polymerase subunit RPC12/RpoP
MTITAWQLGIVRLGAMAQVPGRLRCERCRQRIFVGSEFVFCRGDPRYFCPTCADELELAYNRPEPEPAAVNPHVARGAKSRATAAAN